MPDDPMFGQAVAALRAGQRSRARELLAKLIRADPNNPQYWLWMSTVAESDHEKVFCLQALARIEPGSEVARVGLALLGSATAPAVRPAGQGQRRRSPARIPRLVAAKVERATGTGRRGIDNWVAGLTLVAAVVVLGLVGWGVKEFSDWERSSRIVLAPRLPSPSAIPSPVASPTLRPTQVLSKGVPLGEYVGYAPLPTPLYGATPHPVIVAYNQALQAYSQGSWQEAIDYLGPVLQVDPKAADVYYLEGECLRMEGQPEPALRSYEDAIQANPRYAPAYLGRARITLGKGDVPPARADLDRALDLDPQLIDAYLVRAQLSFADGGFDAARTDLQRALQIDGRNAAAWLELSKVESATGSWQAALVDAYRSQAIDPTLVDSYLLLGQVFVKIGSPALGLGPLQVYTTYAEQDPIGWMYLGEAQAALGHTDQALTALARALALSPDLLEARLTHGNALLESGGLSGALEDFRLALKLAPDSFAAQAGMTRTLIAMGETQSAGEEVAILVARAGSAAEAAQVVELRALLSEQRGDSGAAAADWRALTSLAGASEAMRAEAYLHLIPQASATPTPVP